MCMSLRRNRVAPSSAPSRAEVSASLALALNASMATRVGRVQLPVPQRRFYTLSVPMRCNARAVAPTANSEMRADRRCP
jgi:hypothetical protein